MLHHSIIGYSVIIPAYKSGCVVNSIYQQVYDVLSRTTNSFEIIIVDDASPDNTWENIQTISKTIGNIKAVRLQTNVGQHTAIFCGIQHAQGEFIITLDDDLQFSPSDIPKLIEKQQFQDADIIYGTPVLRKHSFWRNVASRMALHAFHLCLGTSMQGSPFRLFKRALFNTSSSLPPIVFIDGIAHAHANTTDWVSVSHNSRYAGVSGHQLIIQGLWALKLIYTYSSKKVRQFVLPSSMLFILFTGAVINIVNYTSSCYTNFFLAMVNFSVLVVLVIYGYLYFSLFKAQRKLLHQGRYKVRASLGL